MEPSRGAQNAVFRAYRYGPEHMSWLRRERDGRAHLRRRHRSRSSLVLRLRYADIREDGPCLSPHQFGGSSVGLPVGAGECHEGAGPWASWCGGSPTPRAPGCAAAVQGLRRVSAGGVPSGSSTLRSELT
ncbi:hypothetical protein FCI23_38735 [Actinacidiphila oryziradicis]|uniref:Uncharacterized protein n=1 Tax=Actinacidiphila oryziradicis TaxID=2571141 RepID=A0A4U0S0B8_9ACTN|nr:hypothetical protein FCI23_38735 [Actinacidiphila oryziradicis]